MRVWIIASLTLKVTSWGYLIHGIYRPSLPLDYSNLFQESMTLWLWMSGKRNVSVCIGHELANALYHVWVTPTRSTSRSNSRLFKHAFFHTNKEQIYMCSYKVSVGYIYVVSYLVWRGLLCSIIFHTHMKCICRWKFIKNKKTRKMKHAYNKDKARSIILKR